MLSFSARAFGSNFGPAEIPAPLLISPKRRQARDAGGKVASCSRVCSCFLHCAGESASSWGEVWRWEAEANRGWTGPAERIPGAGCPTAQARYAVGNEEEEDPEARQG